MPLTPTASQTADPGIAGPNAVPQLPVPGAKPAAADAANAVPTDC